MSFFQTRHSLKIVVKLSLLCFATTLKSCSEILFGFQVTYRVGQIVRCKRNNAAGVIVGWDETPKAPEASKADDDFPYYLVLIDTIEANTIYDQLLYLAEEELIMEERLHKRITNLGVSKYFETYQNGRYLMRPWLQEIYPRD